MTGILVLLFLLLFAAGASVYSLTQLTTLKTRLRDVERQLSDLRGDQVRIPPNPPKIPLRPARRTPASPDAAVAAEADRGPEKTAEASNGDAPTEPWAEAEAGAALPPPPLAPPRPTIVDRVMDNIIANWVIWLAALSLALGGVFIVQYGIERGYLGPVARVIAALAFGVALIGVAEYVRRKTPDQAVGYFSAHVALAAGGIASLFAGVVAAHVLYDLTNAPAGFATMAAVSWLALLGGVIYGPVLAVIGLLGAYVSPILVDSPNPSPLMYLYFGMVLLASLAVERWQRWIWLSALAVTGAAIWGLLLHAAMPGQLYPAPYFAAVVLLAATVPAFGLPPKSADNTWLTPASFAQVSHQYPTVLAVITALAITVLLVVTSRDGLAHWQAAILAALFLLAVSILAFGKAQNLDQMAAIFGLGVIGTVGGVGLLPGSEGAALFGTDYDQVIRKYFPFAARATLALTLLYLAGSFWRSARSARPVFWNAMTALLPLLALIVLWQKWSVTQVLTDGNWQGLAALLTALLAGTVWLVGRHGERMLTSADVLCCGAFLSLGFLSYLALSPELQVVGFAALSVAAFLVESDRGFRYLGWVSLLYASLSFGRMVLDPGLMNGVYGTFLEGPVYTASATLLFGAGLWRATEAASAARIAQFETATVAGLGISASILLGRVVESGYTLPDHALVGLFVSVWLILAMVQFKRAEMIAGFTRLRRVLGFGYLGLAMLVFCVGAFFLDPVLGEGATPVAGFFPIDSIVIAYALPALILAASIRIPYLPPLLPAPIGLPLAGALAIWMIILEIRRFWHGNDIYGYTILKPELYSYTVALLIATVACVLAALLRKDPRLRKFGLALAGITALKVFLWDMADLQGLGRATSFIALGLTLAGIAWLFQRFTMEPQPDKQANTDA